MVGHRRGATTGGGTGGRAGWRGSLARGLLGWQLVVVFALLACVALFSVVQSRKSFADVEGRRLLSVAENVAATPGVRENVADPLRRDPLPVFAEGARSLSGADFVLITDSARRVLTSPDPGQVGTTLDVGASTIGAGRSWVGEVGGSLVAHVPVIADDGAVVGLVAAGKATPGFFAGIGDSAQDALALLGIATALGIAGSVLLAWRVKRQTLGLEPWEIAGLAEHREALLHGIREGVLGLDQQHRITLVNARARDLLALPGECVGADVGAFGLNERIIDVLTGRAPGQDQIVLRAGRVLVINRLPIAGLGAVATLRDRTELVELREELAASSRATDTLRAQAHEFSNRLHTIAGLIELGEYDEVRDYVDLVAREQGEWQEQVTSRVSDIAVSALLIAKASLAAEQGAGLRLTDDSGLRPVDERLTGDLVTVVGNLVDNALDALRAAGPTPGDWVEIALRQDDTRVEVVVRDSGPGVAPAIATEVFTHGFTTKAAEHGNRGLGLALTRQTCVRRGGSVDVHNAGGAVFTAVLPFAAEVAR
ncbi:sensor histidine kinase [Actinokineospora bangkokensis]|uniref:histidine kinase n=1 Tax=Actinokineospora bangkokensis TaxID=1193682 RepID=A0A1Q9LLT0_9PSEU|nr:sensor histidine kinase [Actinokineospora bangkokensis]OLR92997.1 histidine kinase [Actinokineospora bangkokensis]